MLTRQEIFTKVVNHLRQQGRRAAINPDDVYSPCKYRTSSGAKCAAGVLIQDEFYTKDLEGKAAFASEVRTALEKSGVSRDNNDLIYQLQNVHDEHLPTVWEEEFQKIAEDFNLVLPPVTE